MDDASAAYLTRKGAWNSRINFTVDCLAIKIREWPSGIPAVANYRRLCRKTSSSTHILLMCLKAICIEKSRLSGDDLIKSELINEELRCEMSYLL